MDNLNRGSRNAGESLSQFHSEHKPLPSFESPKHTEPAVLSPLPIEYWPSEEPKTPEVIVGRTLAACAHPYAAWRLLSISWRVVVFLAYAAAAYFLMLCALFAFDVR